MFTFDGPLRHLRFDSQRTIRERLLEFKNIGDEQCRRIDLMPRTEMFELIKNIRRDDLRSFAVWFYSWSRSLAAHRTFANEIVDTIKAILMCIQSRLEGTIDIQL